MKLGLLGYPITHSLSPMLYQKFLGDRLESYEKFSFEKASEVPPLSFFKFHIDGLSITAPYKSHFLNNVIIESDLIREIGGINTIAFTDEGNFGTNTDFLAVQKIMRRFNEEFNGINIILLGSGVMAKVTSLIAKDEGIELVQYSRRTNPDFYNLDFRERNPSTQTIIINACLREFIFNFPVKGDEIFWDYNYSFKPHEDALPGIFKSYIDGQEMLELQAKEAIKFWEERSPKLNL